MKRFKSLFFFVWIFTVVLLLSVGSCARIGSPSGGPRDSIPPVLLKSEPGQPVTAFKGKRVRLYFDEFPNVKDQDKELLISPPMHKRVAMTVKGKSVIIDFRDDSLLRNTTYRMMFGKSIVDLNEGNAMEDLTYVFSTGNSLDTMMLRGALYDAETAMPVIGALAMAYEIQNDSLVCYGMPDKVARTDSSGVFSLYNLKAKPYYIVVLEDANNNYKYDPGAEKIGFSKEAWVPVAPRHEKKPAKQPIATHEGHRHEFGETKNTDKSKKDQPKTSLKPAKPLPKLDVDLITSFKEPNPKQYILGVERKERRAIRMYFSAPEPKVDSLRLLPMTAFDYVLQTSKNKDTLVYWLSNPKQIIPDTLLLKMSYLRTDTANRLSPFAYKNELIFSDVRTDAKKEKKGGLSGFLKSLTDTTSRKTTADTLKKNPNFTVQPRFIGSSPLLPPIGVSMQFSAPLVSIDTGKLSLTMMKVNVKTKDTLKTQVPFRLIRHPYKHTDYTIQADWQPNVSYFFRADTSVFHDIYGKTNDKITERFQSPDPEKMSSINVKVSGIKVGQHYVVDLILESGALVRRMEVKGDHCKFDFLSAGAYRLRILEDANGNGIQDMGDFVKKILPERVLNVGGVGAESVIHLREGWDIEQEVKLNELFK